MLSSSERQFLRAIAATDDEEDRLAAYRNSTCKGADGGNAMQAMRALLQRSDAALFLAAQIERREMEALAEDEEAASERFEEKRIDTLGRIAMKRALIQQLRTKDIKPAALAAVAREAKQVFGTPTGGGMSQDSALAALHRLQDIEAAKNPEAPAPPTPVIPPKEGEDSIGRA